MAKFLFENAKMKLILVFAQSVRTQWLVCALKGSRLREWINFTILCFFFSHVSFSLLLYATRAGRARLTFNLVSPHACCGGWGFFNIPNLGHSPLFS